ncbi:hypothetical protein BaRGS_00010537 [Batillaria attramentaria]|uniref:Secreted protein n=1 Tax=Batillaria attramentaria TaxID=370345 RepID=A0ABD0LG31_9CAEN
MHYPVSFFVKFLLPPVVSFDKRFGKTPHSRNETQFHAHWKITESTRILSAPWGCLRLRYKPDTFGRTQRTQDGATLCNNNLRTIPVCAARKRVEVD